MTPRKLAVQVARSLHGRWRRLSSGDRDRLRPLADEVKDLALNIRGEADPAEAGRDLAAAGERLASAMVESAEADPDLGEIEVRALRDELARELERLAGADIQASRGRASADGVA